MGYSRKKKTGGWGGLNHPIPSSISKNVGTKNVLQITVIIQE